MAKSPIIPTAARVKKQAVRRKDLTGRVFGLATVLHFEKNHEVTGAALWRCRCDCWPGTSKEFVTEGRTLLRGHVRSCGCYRVSTSRRVHTTHGEAHTDIHNIWAGIKKRTGCSTDVAYKRYGAVGITMCEEWRNSYEAFRDYVGPRPSKKHTLDRIEGTKGYFPGNVRWATYKEQALNRKSNRRLLFDGKNLTLSEWGEKLGIDDQVLGTRLKAGWSIQKTLTTRLREHKKTPRHFGREAEDFVTG